MATKDLTKYHPKPCANCEHRDMHSEVSGCMALIHKNPDAWCDCEEYVNPRNRAAERAEGVAAGRDGADAALHGHAMTHDAGQWRENAEDRLKALLEAGEPFTAEDVTDVVGNAPSPNAIGGLFRLGWFTDQARYVQHVTATRGPARGRALRQWVRKDVA